MSLIPPSITSLTHILLKIIVSWILANKITADTPLCAKCDLTRFLTLLCNLNIQNDTLLGLNNFYDEINLPLTASIKQAYKPILPDFQKVDPTTPLFEYLVPTEKITNHPHAY